MLRLEEVTVRFGGLTALNAVSLAVGAGETVGLVGPNGAGKTTLFNAVSGLVRPAHGRIVFDSVDVLRIPAHGRARRGIGRTFQVPQPMHGLTVRENLLVAQRFGAGAVEPERIAEILDLIQLGHKADRDAVTELSFRELKALEVGKALAIGPKLLLLDEVLAGLETAGKRLFMRTLADLRARFGIAMLIIEHDLETVGTLCQRIAVLNFGALIADGAPDAVFADPAVIKSYTGGDDA